MAGEMIRVVNQNAQTLRGRYDGQDYVFKTGKPIDLTIEACAHIFGFGQEDKTQALNMLGWLVPGKDTLADALKKLDQVAFLVGRTVYDEECEALPAVGTEPGDAPTSQVPVGSGQRRKLGAAANP
jgi:hypothetical protein